MPQRLSLTPPECYGTYSDGKAGSFYTSTQCSDQDPSSRYDAYAINQHYLSRASEFTVPLFTKTAFRKENDYQAAQGSMASGNSIPGAFGLPNARMLPVIHVAERTPADLRQSQLGTARVAPPVKEETATGGVAAHLDYEMDRMAEFVAEMAQGMYDLYESRICLADIDIIRSVNPKAFVASAFRKYVLQVLSSTRLPSSTILLGLHYLATRMSLLSSDGRYPTERGKVYHMLTVALLLGSKFLDDNTFQNRSWSEVSNIPVSELNDLELDWLLSIKWNMHVDHEDPQGFTLWRSHWQRWQANKRFGTSPNSLKLRSMDVSVQSLPPALKTQRSPTFAGLPARNKKPFDSVGCNDYDLTQWQAARYDQWSSFSTRTDYSPPSAPETGPATPEYYGRLSDTGYTHQLQPSSGQTRQINPQCPFPPLQRTPYSIPHPQSYINQIWNGHLITCNCMSCVPYSERYHIVPAYGLQPVMG